MFFFVSSPLVKSPRIFTDIWLCYSLHNLIFKIVGRWIGAGRLWNIFGTNLLLRRVFSEGLVDKGKAQVFLQGKVTYWRWYEGQMCKEVKSKLIVDRWGWQLQMAENNTNSASYISSICPERQPDQIEVPLSFCGGPKPHLNPSRCVLRVSRTFS